MQCKITLFVVPTFLRGPRTIDFCNNLYFNKIQIWLVRGPSHIGLPSVILMPVSPPYSHSGDMHPNNATEGVDATGSVYHGSQAHISRPSLDLCQGGRFPRLHWQMEKVEEQIPSWRTASLRTSFISKDAVSDGLRNRFTWGRDSLPGLHTIPAFPISSDEGAVLSR